MIEGMIEGELGHAWAPQNPVTGAMVGPDEIIKNAVSTLPPGANYEIRAKTSRKGFGWYYCPAFDDMEWDVFLDWDRKPGPDDEFLLLGRQIA